jgi:hypothetical protein
VPLAAEGDTVAVSVKLAPAVGVVVELASVVAVVISDPDLTTTETALDVLAAYAVEPLYTAVSEYVPAVENDVVSVAVPELSVPVPSTVVPA